MRSLVLALAVVALAACDKPASKDTPGATPSSTSGATSPSSASPSSADAERGFVIVDVAYGGEHTDVIETVKSEVVKAKAQNLKPFVEFAAGWCEPCQAIKKSLGDSRMKAAFKGSYIIRLDADEWGEHLKGSGFSPSAIPVFIKVGDDGKPIGKSIDGGAWDDNIPENMAPPLDKFFHAT